MVFFYHHSWSFTFGDQQVSNVGKHNIFNGNSPVLCCLEIYSRE